MSERLNPDDAPDVATLGDVEAFLKDGVWRIAGKEVDEATGRAAFREALTRGYADEPHWSFRVAAILIAAFALVVLLLWWWWRRGG